MSREKLVFKKDLNFYFLILTFQEKYDLESFEQTKKNIQSKIEFKNFIKFLKDINCISVSLYKKIVERSFLNNFEDFEIFIKKCDKSYSFYIKYFYASVLSKIKNSDDFVENFDDDYMNDIYNEYYKFFDKRAEMNGFYLTQTDLIYYVTDNIFKVAPSLRFNYISCPKIETKKNFIKNKEDIEELLDGLDALTIDEVSIDMLKTLRKKIFEE